VNEPIEVHHLQTNSNISTSTFSRQHSADVEKESVLAMYSTEINGGHLKRIEHQLPECLLVKTVQGNWRGNRGNVSRSSLPVPATEWRILELALGKHEPFPILKQSVPEHLHGGVFTRSDQFQANH